VLWNCRNEGITAMSDALIENNIVFDAEVGVNIQTYSDESFSGSSFVENLVVRHNTVFRCRSACASVSGWSAAGNGTAFTGNALYQETAGKTSFSGNTGAGLCRGNVYYGQSSTQNGFGQGAGLSDFAAVSASAAASGLDFYPAAGAPVIDVLTQPSDWAQTDFNRTVRPYNGAGDAGAYEYTVSQNPGWRIAEGFKDSAYAGIEGKLFPAGRVLCRNTPNPFYGATRILFSVPLSVDAGTARIVVYDVKGRRVASLPAEPAGPGTRASIWAGRDGLGRPAAEGVYYYELAAPGLAKKAGRMVRLR